jgi:large subunit ribosomal protein L28
MAGTGTCDLCGKHVMFGHNVSHAANATNRKFGANIQSTHLMVDGTLKRVHICTRCLRTLSKTPKGEKQA